jgi:hypothetical protein
VRDDDRDEHGEAVRAHVRQQRLIALVVGAGCLSFLLFYFAVIPALRGGEKPTASAVRVSPSATSAPSSPASLPSPTVAAASPVAAPTDDTTPGAPPRPAIVQKPIHLGAERLQQMAAYSQRHYGDDSTVLTPKAIVLHYTAGGTMQAAWDTFASNQPNVGELPGTVAHFIIDKDGTIYQLLPLDVRGRHTIGLNHVAIGIEFVEEGTGGDAAAVDHIFGRRRQIDAGVDLVRWLQYRFDIPTADVAGHGTADESRYFKDLEGWTNDHGDWGPAQVRRFRERLRRDASRE